MRFMLLKFVNPAGADALPDAPSVEAAEHFNQALRQAGVLLAHDRLLPPSPSAGRADVLIAYWLIQARSREEAVAWAARCPVRAPDVIDIRQVLPNDRPATGPKPTDPYLEA